MKRVIEYFIQYPIASNVLLFLLLIFGYFGLNNLNSTFFPEQPTLIIKIETVFPGASPQEVEEGIVNKIEDNLKGVTGIEEVTSEARENAGSITVEVLRDYDTDLVLQDVKNAVDQISSFPDGMEPPVVYKVENLTNSISYAIRGDLSLRELKTYARDIEDDLLAIEGISKVELAGFPNEEIEILVDENALRRFDISFEQVSSIVRNSNLEITGGVVKGERLEKILRADQKEYYAEGLEDIIVKATEDGAVVRLKDIAKLKNAWSESNPNRSWFNGERSVEVQVKNTIYEDLISIADTVSLYMAAFNDEHEEVQASLIRDSSDILNQRIDLLQNNGITGFILVVVVLALFLNIRLAFWVAISIPVCFAGMFILAGFFGITINVISLFGMILVIGILVDDGIVISESIYQKYEQGINAHKAAVAGTLDVLPAIFSAITTTVTAFALFFFIEGRLGDFFGEMAFVVIATLVFSLVEGALILPDHVAHSKALNRNAKLSKLENWWETEIAGRFYKRMQWVRNNIYAPALRYSMRNSFLAFSIPVFVLLFCLGMIQGGFVKTTFFPFIERDDATISLSMPAGTREQITKKWLDYIENSTWKVNEKLSSEREDSLQMIQNVQVKIGPTKHQGTVNISLLNTEDRGMSSLKVADYIREEVGTIEEAENLSFGTATPFGKPISIALSGSNIKELQAAVDFLKDELKDISALKDVIDDNQEGQLELNVKLKEKARLLGIDLGQLVSQVRSGFFGREIQRLQRGVDEVKVWVRYDDNYRQNLENLEEMLIRVGDKTYPFEELATLQPKSGVIAIRHLNGKRTIKVEADIGDPNESVTDLTAEIKSDVTPVLKSRFGGVDISFEGQNKEAAKSQKSTQKIIGPIVLIMFFIVVLTFKSVGQAVLIFLLIPFGFIGVTVGHYIHNIPISLFSALGIIALIGVLINDSLVFVSTFNQLIKDGKEWGRALFEAGISRFRPIILTTLTTVAGLGPLMFNQSFQAQFLKPMAVSIAYGLFFITGVILIVLPILMQAHNFYKRFLIKLYTGKWLKPIEVESAFSARENYFILYVIGSLALVLLFLTIINIISYVS